MQLKYGQEVSKRKNFRILSIPVKEGILSIPVKEGIRRGTLISIGADVQAPYRPVSLLPLFQHVDLQKT